MNFSLATFTIYYMYLLLLYFMWFEALFLTIFPMLTNFDDPQISMFTTFSDDIKYNLMIF